MISGDSCRPACSNSSTSLASPKSLAAERAAAFAMASPGREKLMDSRMEGLGKSILSWKYMKEWKPITGWPENSSMVFLIFSYCLMVFWDDSLYPIFQRWSAGWTKSHFPRCPKNGPKNGPDQAKSPAPQPHGSKLQRHSCHELEGISL